MGRGTAWTKGELEMQEYLTSKLPQGLAANTLKTRLHQVLGTMRRMAIAPPTPPSMAWLGARYEEIVAVLHEAYKENRGTLMTNLVTLQQVAKCCGEEAAYTQLSAELQKLFKERTERQKDQAKSARQQANWCTMGDVRKVAEPYINALQQMTRGAVDTEMIQLGLAAALNTWEPPMRDVYSSCRIVRTKPTEEQLGHGKPNLLYVPPGRSRACAWVYVNTDKVTKQEYRSGNLGPANWKLQSETSKLLKHSLNLWQREQVMFDSEHPQNCHRYKALVLRALSPRDKSVGAQMVRTLYVTEHYNKFKHAPTYRQKEALANKMRHSPASQELIYRKV